MTGRLLRVNFAELAPRLILGGNDFQRKQLRVYSNITGFELHCMNAYNNLSTVRETNNAHDRFAVAVKKKKLTVGHLPRETSKLTWFFLKRVGNITCTVKGRRCQSPLEQGGLEVPCKLSFSGPEHLVAKLKKLLA